MGTSSATQFNDGSPRKRENVQRVFPCFMWVAIVTTTFDNSYWSARAISARQKQESERKRRQGEWVNGTIHTAPMTRKTLIERDLDWGARDRMGMDKQRKKGTRACPPIFSRPVVAHDRLHCGSFLMHAAAAKSIWRHRRATLGHCYLRPWKNASRFSFLFSSPSPLSCLAFSIYTEMKSTTLAKCNYASSANLNDTSKVCSGRGKSYCLIHRRYFETSWCPDCGRASSKYLLFVLSVLLSSKLTVFKLSV